MFDCDLLQSGDLASVDTFDLLPGETTTSLCGAVAQKWNTPPEYFQILRLKFAFFLSALYFFDLFIVTFEILTRTICSDSKSDKKSKNRRKKGKGGKGADGTAGGGDGGDGDGNEDGEGGEGSGDDDDFHDRLEVVGDGVGGLGEIDIHCGLCEGGEFYLKDLETGQIMKIQVIILLLSLFSFPFPCWVDITDICISYCHTLDH